MKIDDNETKDSTPTPNEIAHCSTITNPHYYDLSENIPNETRSIANGIFSTTTTTSASQRVIGGTHRRLTLKVVACIVSRDQSHMAWLFEDGLVKWKKMPRKVAKSNNNNQEEEEENEKIFERYTKENGRSLAFGDAFYANPTISQKCETESTEAVNTRVKLSALGSQHMLLLAVGSAFGSIRVYDVTESAKNPLLFVLHSHREAVLGLSFSNAHNAQKTTSSLLKQPLKLASCSSAGEIKLWDMFNDGNMYKTLTSGTSKQELFACEWSPDSSMLCSVGANRHAALWDMNMDSISMKEPRKTILKGHLHDVVTCSFSPDGFLLATGSSDTRVCVWSTMPDNQHQLLRTFYHLLPAPSSIFASGCNDAHVKRVSFTKDGAHLVSLCDDSKLRLWSLNDEKVPVGVGYHKQGTTMTLFDDNGMVMVGSKTGHLDVYKLPPVNLLKLTELCRPVINANYQNAAGIHSILPKECKQFLSYFD